MIHDLSTQKGRYLYVEAMANREKPKSKPLMYWGLDRWGNEVWE